MADDRLRSAERAFRTDPSDANVVAYVSEWARAGGPDPAPFDGDLLRAWLVGGGRDPRLWPRPGDVVEREHDRYRSYVFEVVAMPLPLNRESARSRCLEAYYDPTKQRTERGAPVKWALVRRRRRWSTGETHEDSVSLIGWQRGMKDARVCKAACEACHGAREVPSCRASSMRECTTPLERHSEVGKIPCAACFGTGCAIGPKPEARKETKAERAARRSLVVEQPKQLTLLGDE